MAAGPVALDLSAQDSTGETDSSSVGVLAEQLYAGILSYTAMRTQDTGLPLSTTAVNAFTPTALPCPSAAGAAGCTIRVTATSQFSGIAATEAAQASIIFTGTGTLGPAALINVAANSGTNGSSSHSVQWVRYIPVFCNEQRWA